MGVHVFVKGRVHRAEIGQVERRVERQRCTMKFCVARLEVNLRCGAIADQDAAIQRPVLLVFEE